MKWTYQIRTNTERLPENEQKIEGEHYGSFGSAVDQVHRAVMYRGWDKNTTSVVIVLTPDEPS